MTPSDTTAKRKPEPRRRDDDIAAAILACGRDERPALQALFKLTGPRLYGVALQAAQNRAEAEQSVVQAYLAAFNEAQTFEPGKGDAMSWLEGLLARHLPGLTGPAKPGSAKVVEPPAELWQKLDIALGLKRLDRHIKPGVAAQARGRDPMPNANDRSIDRQLRFWRTLAAIAVIGFVAAAATATTLGLRGSSDSLGAAPAAPAPDSAAAAPAASAREVVPPASRRLAILRPAAAGRLWRVEETAGALAITPVPPLAVADAVLGDRMLVLWVRAGDRPARRLGRLEPDATTTLSLPADLAGDTLELVVSLEAGLSELGDGEPGDGPAGTTLFSGRLVSGRIGP
jgi:anti-sigma-K factor RskA